MKLYLFVAAMWLTTNSFAVTVTLSYADFLADPNWTVPAGVVQVTVQVWGAGGGAGGGASADDVDGGGGGGFSTTANIVVVPGASHAFVVGLGGPGGAANGNGTAGLTSSLLGVAAGGGGGGVAGNIGGRAGGTAGVGADFNGGAGGAGSNNKHGGGGGGEAACTGSGGDIGGTGGDAGEGGSGCDGGDGASATQAEGAAGVNATEFGGGGGGASGNQTGGAGANGQIVLNYTPTVCDPCYSAGSGNWNADATWSPTSGGSGPVTPTAAAGNVHPAYVIEGTDKVNMNVAGDALSLRVGDAGAGELEWTAAVALTIHGDAGVVVDADGVLDNNGQADPAGIVFDHQANGSSFVFSNAGVVGLNDLSVTETGGTGNSTLLTMSGAGTIAIAGDFATVGTSTEIQNDGTVTANTYTSSGAGMTLDNNGILTIATTATIGGTNTIDNAGTFTQTAGAWTSTADGVVFTNSGTVNIDAGNIDFGDFTATINNSSNFNLDGDFRNITAAEVTWNNLNGGSMTYSGAATQDADLAIVASAATNTWSYDLAGAQNIYAPAAGYYNLTVAGGNTKTMQAATTVSNTLGLTNGIIHTNAFNLAHT